MTRRNVLRAGVAVLAASAAAAGANRRLRIRNLYSPRNRRRPLRPHTLYIVLHTTEGADGGSLNKVRRYGEAHYFVDTKGTVYRIIDKRKIATHAGRSMWQGHRNIDNYSIGIEVAGYHDQDITEAQYGALRELLRQLQSLYGISDQNVLTHSMVAYGRPNRFYHSNHRGRKRCGMIFARPDVRAKLGLDAKPARDADVDAGRLKIADVELQKYLYAPAPAVAAAIPAPSESNVISADWTAWSIAREQYDHHDTTYMFPDGLCLKGDQIQDWSRIPVGTKVVLSGDGEEEGIEAFLEIGKEGGTPQELAGDAYDSETTIYFFPNGLIRTGRELKGSARNLLDSPPKGTRLLVGYIYGGYVKTRRPASAIAGRKWNYPSTFYRFPDGTIQSGDQIDAAAIPARTLVFYQN